MNIVQMNLVYGRGSTGKIMVDINSVAIGSGINGYMVTGYGAGDPNSVYSITGEYSINNVRKDILISRLSGVMGYKKKKETLAAVNWIESKHPDIVHLHNIHGDWINLEILFDYLRKKDIPVVWTLHDCWAFTGRCSHFENCGCEKWKTGCFGCKNKSVYPITYFFDWSKRMWEDKNRLFTGINRMVIVTPSDWLGNYVRQSFLGKYPVTTIHNGIDLSLFQPTYSDDFKKRLVGSKKMILGVASMWTERKGLYDFYKLADILGEEYKVVLVGLNSRQIKSLPKNIHGIARTSSVHELAQLYSVADFYVNPTYLDNYPTTNLEAQACGTATITYRTGGSPESVMDKMYVVEQGDIETIANIIRKNARGSSESYRDVALENFDARMCFSSYVKLYESLFANKNWSQV